jgi:glycine cleavage system H protein
VKTVNELIAPVSGQVVAINTELDDHPTIVNEDPYHEGWLIELELSDRNELEDPKLMDPDEYDDFISGEEEA